ncbi:MAG: hypothetical protein M0Z72_01570 [Deltaproteobacteria bacterium]|nr:hypothetical protein [Deltaproteobacteria bacterium]
MQESALTLSKRQIKRLVRRFRLEGAKGLANKRRNAVSNRRLPEDLRLKVLELYRENYRDFAPMFFCEKLSERHNIEISKETLRKWLLNEGLWKRERKTKLRKSLRERKPCFGEMLKNRRLSSRLVREEKG